MIKKQILVGIVMLLITMACGGRPSGDELASGFRNVAKLATLEVQVHKIVSVEKNEKLLFFPIGKSNRVVSSDAVVKIGVDLNEIQPEDVDIKGETITLKLPPIKVVDFIYPPSRFELLDASDKGFTHIKVEELNNAYCEAETDIRRWLNQLGLEQTAETRNRRYFRNFLINLGYKDVNIHFSEPVDKAKPLIDY